MPRRRAHGQGTLFKQNPTGPWIAMWLDADGRRRKQSTRTTDRRSAERILASKVNDAALRRAGIIDQHADQLREHSSRSIQSHITDYKAHLQAGGAGEKHVASTCTYLNRATTFCEWSTVANISADSVNRFVLHLRKDCRTNLAVGKPRPASSRTIQAYLVAIKSFTKWLVDHNKLSRDPLSSVKKPSPKADRRKWRRMILPDEWPLIWTTTLNGGPRQYVDGRTRAIIYAVAIQTGLRSSELRVATIDPKLPLMICKDTKNDDEAKQHIKPDLAILVREELARLKVKSLPMPDEWISASILREDVLAAREKWIAAASNDVERTKREKSDFLAITNHQGESIDLHALRHTCGSWLSIAGVNPKVIQKIMRHSTIQLTMDTYGHLMPGQETDAVQHFPATPNPVR